MPIFAHSLRLQTGTAFDQPTRIDAGVPNVTTGAVLDGSVDQLVESLPASDGCKLGSSSGGPSCQVCPLTLMCPLLNNLLVTWTDGNACASSITSSNTVQVEDCRRELSDLSAYHQKCRICDVHIKAPSFMRAGLKQRFCQRCGRCHELDAFDGSKRSCIAQLAKHNARCAASLPCFRPLSVQDSHMLACSTTVYQEADK
jgi:hypothetical protein